MILGVLNVPLGADLGILFFTVLGLLTAPLTVDFRVLKVPLGLWFWGSFGCRFGGVKGPL